MNWTVVKLYAGLMGSAAIVLLVQATFVPDADEALKSARSEITAEALAARFDAPTTRAFAPETRSASKDHSTISGSTSVVDVTPGPAPVPAGPTARHAQLSRLPWPWPWLLGLRPLLDEEENLAINDATASEIQTPPTNEVITAADPLVPISGEMTLQFPIVKVAGSGLDFSFALTYRSGFSYDGPVGKRWEHNWNARFKYVSANLIQRMANNRVDDYVTKSGQSSDYESPAGFSYEK
jgi:hypothetical protein